jgi:hypothetical protein
VFGATAIVRVAESVPEELPEKVTQLAFDVAAHVQLAPEVLVNVTLKLPPDAAGACDVDDNE